MVQDRKDDMAFGRIHTHLVDYSQSSSTAPGLVCYRCGGPQETEAMRT